MTEQVWSTEIGSGDIAILEDYAADIDRYMSIAANQFINIGVTLNIARQMFPGDKEFGRWRAERTSINSASTANKYMAVARKFSSKKISGKVSYSVLKELLPASEKVIKEVEKEADSGKKVTRASTREKVAAEKPDGDWMEVNGPAIVNMDTAERADARVAAHYEEEPIDEGIQAVVDLKFELPLADRLRAVQGQPMDHFRAWFVFGMEVPEVDPNPEVVEILFSHHIKNLTPLVGEEYQREVLDAAYKLIKG